MRKNLLNSLVFNDTTKQHYTVYDLVSEKIFKFRYFNFHSKIFL